MQELWDKAREYGLVRVVTTDKGRYYCCIEFRTISQVKLEAQSTFDNLTPSLALSQAIERAEQIVKSLQEELPKLGKPTST